MTFLIPTSQFPLQVSHTNVKDSPVSAQDLVGILAQFRQVIASQTSSSQPDKQTTTQLDTLITACQWEATNNDSDMHSTSIPTTTTTSSSTTTANHKKKKARSAVEEGGEEEAGAPKKILKLDFEETAKANTSVMSEESAEKKHKKKKSKKSSSSGNE